MLLGVEEKRWIERYVRAKVRPKRWRRLIASGVANLALIGSVVVFLVGRIDNRVESEVKTSLGEPAMKALVDDFSNRAIQVLTTRTASIHESLGAVKQALEETRENSRKVITDVREAVERAMTELAKIDKELNRIDANSKKLLALDIGDLRKKAEDAQAILKSLPPDVRKRLDELDQLTKKIESAQLLSGVAVGAVVASLLDGRQHAALVGDPDKFDPATSRWAPADGRSVSGSAYAQNLGKNQLPDLRGLFLRGLNRTEDTRSDWQVKGDSQGHREPGEFQADTVGPHTHRIPPHSHEFTGRIAAPGKSAKPISSDGGGVAPSSRTSTSTVELVTQENAGEETRPRNAAVYYYIKIN